MNFVKVEYEYTPQVALESIVGNLDKSFGSMVGSIANFFPSLKSAFVGATDNLETLKAIPSNVLSTLTGFTSNKNYSYDDFTTYTKLKVVTPESFTGNLHDYCSFLQQSWEFLQVRVIPELDVYYAKLASFASNKESKIALIDTSGIYKSMQAAYKELVNESVTYFGKSTHNKRSSELGVAFSDFDQFFKAADCAKNLSKQLSPKQVGIIRDKVNKIVSVLDIIIDDAQKREYDKASYEAVKSLATGIYALAEFIEFYSVTYYRITEFAYVMSENNAVIRKIK